MRWRSWLTSIEGRLALVRAVLVGLGGGLLMLSDPSVTNLVAVGTLGLVAAVGSTPPPVPLQARFQAPLEAVAASFLLTWVGPLPEMLLPYLLAPALAAGLRDGAVAAVLSSGLAGAVLLVGGYLGHETLDTSEWLQAISQWTLLALVVGLLGAWINRLLVTSRSRADSAYTSAHRLVSQLRLLTRQLSAGLDPITLSEQLLSTLRRQLDVSRAGVYLRAEGGRLTEVAADGARVGWPANHALLDEAWASGEPVQGSLGSVEESRHGLVLPMKVGLRTVGLVAVERSAPFTPAEIDGAAPALDEHAVRVETALLFGEVRTLATAEERRRVAREIHDGIAQELASLGYLVDDMAARAAFLPDLEQDLQRLRAEMTRIVRDLRLSIFDLRSEVEPSAGFGTALTEYVQQIRATSGLEVHLSLDEGGGRLPVEKETELLRIAQEAVTNARKHAKATNLWVFCSVSPPNAVMRIEDDGRGLGTGRIDSFGLDVMRERAERIGADLSVGNRPDGGTLVEVRLSPAERAH